ncbi:MAG: carbohydrate-binding family 9-like protein [Hyalangium sp.]|uniref:carbohydrate-binding family 9-like protein n=1 Tax=Hyalangium sp. TaxID=2028555 RepID=UPI00389AC48F
MRSLPLSVLPLLTLTLMLAACRDEQAGPRPRTQKLPPAEQTQLHTLDAAPPELTFRSGATFGGGAVVYLGSRVTPAQAASGQPVTLSHYFQALRPPPQDFKFFVHIIDPASGQLLMNADHDFQNGLAPLAMWPVGKVLEDTHTIPMPGSPARVVLGFWRGDERLPVDDPRAHDGSNRMLGPTLGSEPELPEYKVHRAKKPPVIDGSLEDEAWKDATPVVLHGSLDGRPVALRTEARLLYDDANLYVSFDAEDPDVWGALLKRDDPIYNEDVVEIFLDANADGKTYNELEVSPHNVIFDAYFPARRQGMDTSWDSGMKTAVKVHGTIDNPADRDERWTVELQIPIARLAEVPNIPPKKGDRWRFNLYRLDHLERHKVVEGQAFSPTFVPDFHALPRFGWLTFD